MNEKTIFDLLMPDYKVQKEEIPTVRIKSIHFENFKVFEDAYFDFTKDGKVTDFACFHGPNGCGKTTILNCIQTLFSRFDGYDLDRLQANLGKAVRRTDADDTEGIYGNRDFLVTAEIESSIGNYVVKLNKEGFVPVYVSSSSSEQESSEDVEDVENCDDESSESSDAPLTIDSVPYEDVLRYEHPDKIKKVLYRLCFSTRFDMELDKFQLERSKWPMFKDLFESVTGFKVEEQTNVFNFSEDPIQAKIFEEYVLGFKIYKPNEIITNRDCSAGERKIIKSFSTLLNKEYEPQILLVDNVAMHVESGRHLELISAMKRCFPNSQIFATTHSYNISRNFGDRSQLYDLRLINFKGIIKKQPWRAYLQDEVRDALLKLQSTTLDRSIKQEKMAIGMAILGELEGERMDATKLHLAVRRFMKDVAGLFIDDLVEYYSRQKNILKVR